MEHLDLFYMCDDGFAPITGTSMTSLFCSNPRSEIELDVYLLGVNLSDENRRRFLALSKEYGQPIHLIDAAAALRDIERMNIAFYRGSAITNLRLSFDLLLPQSIRRCLYLDSDTLIVSSLAPLARLDMQGKALGMVLDAYGEVVRTDRGNKTPYYNAGVLLFDCDRWRAERWREKIFAFIENSGAQYAHPDQDIYNLVCQETILRLPPQYNFQCVHRMYPDRLYLRWMGRRTPYYTAAEIDAARQSPAVLHMVRVLGTNPWSADEELHPDREIFQVYLQESLWKGMTCPSSRTGVPIKIERVLQGLLPPKIFFPLAAFCMRFSKI